MNPNIEIILCGTCKGSGLTNHEELTCYHKREYDYWTTTCKFCVGSGRQTKTTTIKIEAYVQEEADKE